MKRSSFFCLTFALLLLFNTPTARLVGAAAQPPEDYAKVEEIGPPFTAETRAVYDSIASLAQQGNWHELPFAELMTRVALEMLDSPYEAGTIEDPVYENCKIHFTGFDCVTFYETVLCIARTIKYEEYSIYKLIEEIEYTRYRGGNRDGYASRLHYTSEWILNNEQKGVVKDITAELGANKHVGEVFFMSKNPDKYAALEMHPDLVPEIEAAEKFINANKRLYLPKEKIASVYDELRDCDIVCFATSIAGLDYAHTGFVHFDEDGNCHLMHASTKHGVIIDTDLAEYAQGIKHFIGISVVRPIDPITHSTE